MTQTIIAIDHDEDMVEVSTNDRKWINKMIKLEEEGHAEELEASIEGNREWEAEIGLFRLPFYRKPRKYTKAQRKAAGERLGKVRAKVAAQKAADAAEAGEDEEEEAPKKKAPAKRKKKAPVRRKKKAAPEPVEEEEVDDEDLEDEIDDDEDEEEDEPEVVVKTRSTRRRRRKKAS